MAKAAVADKAAPKKSGNKNTGKAPSPSVVERFVNYIKGVRTELKRVVWPDREEVTNSSIVVVVALIFFGLFSFLMDSASSQLIFALKNLVG